MKVKDLDIISIARGASCTDCNKQSENIKEIHIGGAVILLCNGCIEKLIELLK